MNREKDQVDRGPHLDLRA